jgi:hypothetical protein
MTLKSAALLALIGTTLMTILSVWRFVISLLNVLHDAVAPVVVFSSFIEAFAWLSVAVFFYYFHRTQARG